MKCAYLKSRRDALGGPVPSRTLNPAKTEMPKLSDFTDMLGGSGDKEPSTTMAFVGTADKAAEGQTDWQVHRANRSR